VVVVEERGNPAGLRRAPTGEEMCHGREREATKGLRSDCSSFSPLYIGPRERGRAQPCPLLQGRGAAKDGEESILPKAPRRCLPPLGLFPLQVSLRMGLLGLVPLAHVGQGAPPTAHVAPGAGGPTRWAPGTLPVVPVQYRGPRNLSRWPKQDFLYINLYLRTIPELLVTSGISSGTPNNIR